MNLSELRLTSGQVAAMLHCSIPMVHRIPVEELPYHRVGTHRRYKFEDVQAYIQKTGKGDQV